LSQKATVDEHTDKEPCEVVTTWASPARDEGVVSG
jgi:hypothetical protein